MAWIEYFSSLDSGIHFLSFLSSFFILRRKTEFIPSALSANHESQPEASLPGLALEP